MHSLLSVAHQREPERCGSVCAGALGCLLTCIFLGIGQGLTLYTLSKFAERYQANNYSVLVRR